MESRLIFRHRRVERSGDTTRESSLLVEEHVQAGRLGAGVNDRFEVREVRRRKPELRSTLLSRKASKQ